MGSRGSNYKLPGLILLILTISTWIALYWLKNEPIPNQIKLTNGMIFDYIIVGAGTSGSVLANQLSENPNITILLIEAGHLFGIFSKIPLMTTFTQKTENDWGFYSEPQKFSSQGLQNQVQYLPRGKGLGGSSQINYMLHFEGRERDFKKWKNLGIHGWEPSEMKKYVYPNANGQCSRLDTSLSLHRNEMYCFFNNSKESDDGIFEISANYSKISEALHRLSYVLPRTNYDVRLSKYNIRNGVRWSVYETFLRPSFNRDNLKIATNSVAYRIKFQGDKAKSVLVQTKNKNEETKTEIFSKNEIILSGGAYQTPLLLQLSGIGSYNDLERIKVKPRIISPMVGFNLHDHVNFPLYVTINVSASITMDKILSFKEFYNYLVKGTGHFSNFGVIGHIDALNDDFGIGIFGTGSVDEKALKDLSNFEQEAFRSLFPFYFNQTQEGFIFITTCYQPKSRGRVFAKSKNFSDPPSIDPNYLHQYKDVQCIIRGIRQIANIIKSPSFQELGSKLHWPKLAKCKTFGPFQRDFETNSPSDQYLECIIRAVGLTSHHPGGTCVMGSDIKTSVVDNQLRVHGVNGLRVVDASVLPTPISGVPNSVLVNMAKRAADMIRNIT